MAGRCRTASVAAALLVAAPFVPRAAEPADLVDPFIGTGGHGHTFPGATLPFGMVQLSPDTRLEGWDGCSGYHFTDDVVYGFSHTHLSGTGISDYGDVLFMPVVGEPPLDNGYRTGPERGYASRFEKSSERAGAGSYAVRLADDGIDVELTATERSGLQRYRFPPTGPAWVVVDLAHRDRVLDSGLRVINDREIEGWRRSTGWARDQHVFFVARFSQPFASFELARDDSPVSGAVAIDGTNVKARFAFGDDAAELLVRVGISAVDVAGARRNLDAEQGERSFDDVKASARETWSAALGRIEVEGGSQDERTIFYTALYHALIAPNVWSDVDGRYRGMDGRVHRTAGRRHYTVFSLWDTFRSTHPLFTLLEPARTSEFVQTFLAQYEQGGRLPVWELAANETDTMIGYHAVPVIADAWVKGLRGYDGNRALDAMVHSATLDHFGLAAYRRQGFVGAMDDGESVSKTLEYAFDDFCIGRMAQELGRRELAATFERRSQGWRHVLDPASGFMRARRNQRFIEPFDPYRVDNHYTEANAWQYGLFVPHDVAGLLEALGGAAAFVERLDATFGADARTTGREQADITGLIGQYAHGNEPSHHMAWLYHWAGQPERSAARVRQILDTLYTSAPDGLSGNEDCGQMSSWYVFAAIGLYPVTPCTDEYVLGVPLFPRVTLRLDGGRTFELRTRGVAPQPGAVVRAATLDGRPLARSFLRHAEIVGGGRLVLTLARKAGDGWGVAPADRPSSWSPAPKLPAAPFLESETDVFRDRVTFALASGDPAATVHYRLLPGDARDAAAAPAAADAAGTAVHESADGGLSGAATPIPPAEQTATSWTPYSEPLEIHDGTTVRFFAERDGVRSPAVAAYLHRVPHEWTVSAVTAPAPQYSPGPALALIDGLRGGADWRAGDWWGVQASDFTATVDLGRRQALARVGASFLQDQRAWIWTPTELVVAVSDDGSTFQEVGRVATTVDPAAPGVVLEELVVILDEAIEARYVRVVATNRRSIPEWHPGHGGDPWIFVDEVLVE